MCDYSLKGVHSRPAKANETLTTHNFSAGTSGFRSVRDTAPGLNATAVCVLPGTEIAFANPIRLKANHGLLSATVDGKQEVIGCQPNSGDLTATFVQINREFADRHHDALRFANGGIVLLTSLEDDQEATVVSLPALPRTLEQKEAQRRVAYA